MLRIDEWLDLSPANHSLRRRILYLFVKLAEDSKKYPLSLFLEGIDIGVSKIPKYRGGFAEVYRGTYLERVVAVKRPHMTPDAQAVRSNSGHLPMASNRSINSDFVEKLLSGANLAIVLSSPSLASTQ
jgi:hypothetical protein